MFRLIFPSRHRRGRGLFGAASNPKRSTAEESQQLADNALAQALWFVRRSAAIANMITLEDCVGLCGLTEEEVLAIAEHEHLPEIAATSLAAYLLSQQQGSEKVLNMIVDDIRQDCRRYSASPTLQRRQGACDDLATCAAPFLEDASRG